MWLETLQTHFGHSSLRPGQHEVVQRIFEGTNTLAVLPTGGGKSLCYQLPALLLPRITIVVSPLIALMRDQVETLNQRGIPAMRWDSDDGDFSELEASIEAQSIKLLYLSPERIQSPPLLDLLRRTKPSLVAIDEAHCVSEWGQSFRPAYLKLSKAIRSLRPDVTLALTATATPEVAKTIRKEFKILKRDQIQTSFHRPNLLYQIQTTPDDKKSNILLENLQSTDHLPAIVYAQRRGDVETLATFLTNNGIVAKAFHAGMPPKIRGQIQDAFLRGEFPVICATIAFGMGVDMPNIRSVIHYHPPKSPEAWLQESGRAGRDGKTSRCLLMVNQNDHESLNSLVHAHSPTPQAVENVIHTIFSQGKNAVISRYDLSTLNDIRGELIDILLARLETQGHLRQDDGSWKWCQAVPLRPVNSILQGFKPSEQKILLPFLETRGRISLLEQGDGSVRSQRKLMKLLAELRETGDARTSFSHSLLHYRIRHIPNNLRELASEMHDACHTHARHELQKIQLVFDTTLSRRCIPAFILKQMGETIPPCGQCDRCLGTRPPRNLPYTTPKEVTESELATLQGLVRERRAPLATPSRLAKFLSGIYSPAMMRYRLYQHDEWAMLDRLPYEDVITLTKSICSS